MKDWPGVSYLVFKGKSAVPGGVLLVDIGYKYNSNDFISFVGTKWEKGSQLLIFLIFLSDLTSLIMFPFDLLFINRYYISYSVLSMR